MREKNVQTERGFDFKYTIPLRQRLITVFVYYLGGLGGVCQGRGGGVTASKATMLFFAETYILDPPWFPIERYFRLKGYLWPCDEAGTDELIGVLPTHPPQLSLSVFLPTLLLNDTSDITDDVDIGSHYYFRRGRGWGGQGKGDEGWE